MDPDDLVSAMERTPGQVAFVSGQEELQLILAHPFAAWRTFLHPSQRKIAYRASYSRSSPGDRRRRNRQDGHRPAPRGLPGRTGRQARPGSRTRPGGTADPADHLQRNLADALDAQLDLLVQDAAVRSRIEVLNVDRLAHRIVKQARGTPVIADERVLRQPLGAGSSRRRADVHPGVPEARVGAGHPRPGPAHRAGVPDLPAHRPRDTAQQGTAQPGLAGGPAGHRGTRRARQSTHIQLANEATHLLREAGQNPCYRHVIVDEAQDLHPAQWRLLRAAVPPGPDDLFIAADPHQRIYDNRVSLASLGSACAGAAAG